MTNQRQTFARMSRLMSCYVVTGACSLFSPVVVALRHTFPTLIRSAESRTSRGRQQTFQLGPGRVVSVWQISCRKVCVGSHARHVSATRFAKDLRPVINKANLPRIAAAAAGFLTESFHCTQTD